MNDRDELINADRSQTVIMHGGQLPWTKSPEPGVVRKKLERVGGEVALATSIVRYEPGSRFASHLHELGEEFLVLEGLFRDEHGSYPAGTYIRNPPGSRHAPFSDIGCVIFVKLRQMARDNVDDVKVFSEQLIWKPITVGIESALLYAKPWTRVELMRIKAGCELPARYDPDGEELFVVNGTLQRGDAQSTVLQQWSWVRSYQAEHCKLASCTDSLLWMKRGHLKLRENDG